MTHEHAEDLKPQRVRRPFKDDEQRRDEYKERMSYETPEEPRYKRTPDVLAANLKRLTALTGKGGRELADEIGVQWRWYRRLLGRGLSRIDKRYLPSLKRITEFFRLGRPQDPIDCRVEELWNPRLDVLNHDLPKPAALESWRQRIDWPYAQKLLELLESGQHDHLRGLIDSLYRLACQEELKTQKSRAVYTEAASARAKEAEPTAKWKEMIKKRRQTKSKTLA
jgi:hypothetical protein